MDNKVMVETESGLKFETFEEFRDWLFRPRTFWERVRYGIPRFFSDMYWAFKYRFVPKHKYNIIRTGLKPGYYDPSIKITFGIFEEVSRWVEHNNPIICEDDEYECVYDRALTLLKDGTWAVNEKNGKESKFIGSMKTKLLVDAADWWKENKDKVWNDDMEDSEITNQVKQHLHNIIDNMEQLWY